MDYKNILVFKAGYKSSKLMKRHIAKNYETQKYLEESADSQGAFP